MMVNNKEIQCLIWYAWRDSNPPTYGLEGQKHIFRINDVSHYIFQYQLYKRQSIPQCSPKFPS